MRNAVYLAQTPGRTIASVSLELKVPAWKLRTWIKESKEKLERSSDLDELVRLQRENNRLKEENEILKSRRVLCQSPAVKYAFVFSERVNHSIVILCDVLEVSRSGYYKWLKCGVSERLKKRAELLQRILEIFEDSRENYGCPRVYEQLRSEGWKCNYKVVEELMRMNEIQARRGRQYRCTTDSKHNLPIAENLLEQNFQVAEPDEVWVSDITYIETSQGWLYLCVFIDLFTRAIVGWSMSERMKTDIVIDAFEMGMANRSRAPIVVHLGPRQSVCERSLSGRAGAARLPSKHEPKRKLLGQCSRRKLLRNTERGTNLPRKIRFPNRCNHRNLRVHRGFLQQKAHTFSVRVSHAGGKGLRREKAPEHLP